MDGLVPRQPVRVGGEIKSVRIVPRAGAPALEVTVSDGRGSVVAVFLGRRKIAGMSPGRQRRVRGRRRRQRHPRHDHQPRLRAPDLTRPLCVNAESGRRNGTRRRRGGQAPVRMRRTSSSESGVTIASTSSPASKIESPRGITTCSLRTIATIVASRGTSRSLSAWSMAGESAARRDLDQSGLTALELEEPHQPPDGHRLLDERR